MEDEKTPSAPPTKGKATPAAAEAATAGITIRAFAELKGLRRGHLALLERRLGANAVKSASELELELAAALKEKI